METCQVYFKIKQSRIVVARGDLIEAFCLVQVRLLVSSVRQTKFPCLIPTHKVGMIRHLTQVSCYCALIIHSNRVSRSLYGQTQN